MTQERSDLLDELYWAVVDGRKDLAVSITNDGLEQGRAAGDLLDQALIPALGEVGDLFESGEYFVPEMLTSARAMQAAMDILRPLLAETGAEPIGTFVMGTVQGDIHDIGKNICNIMLEGAGFDVIDLGVNVAAETFIAAIEKHQPDAVGMSAFLTTTMLRMEPNMTRFREAGVLDGVTVYVGGAPVTQEFANHCGADGYAPQASALVKDLKTRLGLGA